MYLINGFYEVSLSTSNKQVALIHSYHSKHQLLKVLTRVGSLVALTFGWIGSLVALTKAYCSRYYLVAQYTMMIVKFSFMNCLNYSCFDEGLLFDVSATHTIYDDDRKLFICELSKLQLL